MYIETTKDQCLGGACPAFGNKNKKKKSNNNNNNNNNQENIQSQLAKQFGLSKSLKSKQTKGNTKTMDLSSDFSDSSSDDFIVTPVKHALKLKMFNKF